MAVFFLAAGLSAWARTTVDTDAELLLDRWESADGLPENSATSIAQTRDGYLWFGTFAGLVRFDGRRCAVFDPTNTPELPGAEVVMVFLDRKGGLWVSTTAGLARMSEDGVWARVTTADGLEGDYARSFAERPNGDLLMTTFDGHLLEFKDGKFAQMRQPPGEFGRGYLGFVDDVGTYWAVQNEFVGSWNGTEWMERMEFAETSPDSVGGGMAADGGLWILIRKELRKVKNGAVVETRTLPELPGGFWSLMEDKKGNIWISTYDQGLVRLAKDGKYQRWTTANGLLQNNARMVFEDREENLWVGTSGSGLVRLKEKRFTSYGVESGLTELNIKSVARSGGGGMLVGTFGRGLFEMKDGKARKVETAWEERGLKGTLYCQALLVDSAGKIWVGSFDHGLSRMDGAENEIFSMQHTGRHVRTLFEDTKKRVWVGRDEGLCVFDEFGLNKFDADAGLSGQRFVTVAEDAGGRIWTASSAGVFRLEGEKFEEVRDGKKRPIRDVTFLLRAGEGMWMGTKAAGLGFWKAGVVRWIGAADGLPVTAVLGMIEDEVGYYWLASNRGIARVAKSVLDGIAAGKTKGANFILLGIGDGLRTLECASGQQPVCAKDETGRLWFATTRGPAMIDPKKFRIDAEPPKLFFEEMSYVDYAGKRVRFKPSARVEVISPGSSSLETRLAMLSLRAPEGVSFHFTLKEGEKVVAGGDRTANVLVADRLRPGRYLLEVTAKNSDGVRTPEPIAQAFVVQGFLWESPWFKGGGIAGVALALMGGTWAWTRARMSRQLERFRHERAQLKTESALRESEERYRAVVENSPIGVVVWVDDKAVFVNDAAVRIAGVKDETGILGRSVYEFTDPSVWGEARERRRQALEEGISSKMAEFNLLLGNGATRAVEAYAIPFMYRGAPAILNFLIDVSERKKVEMEKAETEQEFRRVAGQMMRIQDEERRRIGRELHDSTGQTLAALEINLGMLARRLTSAGGKPAEIVTECMELAGQCSGEIRTTSYLLHPPLLDEVGLASAIGWYADGFTKRSGVKVKLALATGAARLPAEVELALFRVVQEALTNIHRHSGSETASIRFAAGEQWIELEVADAGRGIEKEKIALFRVGHSNLGVGLAGMRERIRQLGGELTVDSDSTGTRVRVKLARSAT